MFCIQKPETKNVPAEELETKLWNINKDFNINLKQLTDNDVNRNSDKRLFNCNKCEQSFLNESDYLLHHNSHKDDKFACTHCKKKFSSKEYILFLEN